jgi:lysophospholipase L1-like esterase
MIAADDRLSMKLPWMIGVVVLFAATEAALALVSDAIPSKTAAACRAPAATVRIVLVGDSTVTDEAGWGIGFAKSLAPSVQCINRAKSGSSSKSYAEDGWWKKALAEKPDYVLIQFGHNDQPGKGPRRETDPQTTYPENLGRYVDKARAAGAQPVLVTSLPRRHFGSDGKIHSNLQDYVEAVRRVATEKRVPLIDLHARSIDALDRLGPKEIAKFDFQRHGGQGERASDQKTPPDKTHLSPVGSDLFGRMVAEELLKAAPALKPHIE